MERLRQLLFGGSFFAYPILVHAFVVQDNPVAALGLLIGASLALGLLHELLRSPSSSRLWTYLYFALAGFGLLSLLTGRVYALYLPQVLINLSLAHFFGHTLRSGAVPLIERFMRMQLGEVLPPGMQGYARRLTRLWTVFYVVMALIGISLAAFAPLEIWSTFANVVNYLLVAVMFVGQFVYGHVRHRFHSGRDTLAFALRLFRRSSGDVPVAEPMSRSATGSGK
jgi:uncharacterized membrane protein